jgi:hypothetical protein
MRERERERERNVKGKMLDCRRGGIHWPSLEALSQPSSLAMPPELSQSPLPCYTFSRKPQPHQCHVLPLMTPEYSGVLSEGQRS